MFNKLKSLFMSSSSSIASSYYKDFQIVPRPKKTSGAYTTEGKIFKEIEGVKMNAYFIRTDTFSKKDDAIECIERKARIIIDENGEKIFPVSEVTIASNLKEMFLNLSAANDLEFKYGTNAPTLCIENMTLAGK